MKKADYVVVAAVFIIAAFCTVKFIPDKLGVYTAFLENIVKGCSRSGQTYFVKNYFSFDNLLNNELGNPLDSPETVKKSAVPITETDDDVKALTREYEKRYDSSAKGGKIVERTLTDMHSQQEYDGLKVQNRTLKKIDIKKILEEGADLSFTDLSEPTVLIYHTHTHESYVKLDREYYLKGESTQSSNRAENVVRVGDALCEQLKKEGFNVIHDTEIHDDDYNNAYSHSGKSIDKYLKKYPTIDVTIDVHRDSLALEGDDTARTSLVSTVNGKKAAQVMIVTGCEEGNVKDFPDWYKNLHFALGLQKQIDTLFPGLTRPVFFSERRYNMYKTKNSVLIEFGSDGNTLEQAVYSGKMVGKSLAEYLKKYVN